MTDRVVWERRRPGRGVARRIVCYDEVASTMDAAWRIADPAVGVMALTQTAGRGRFGRPWLSEPGGSLLLSLTVEARAEVAGRLSIVAALAASDAVGALSGISPALKWPNDVLLNGRKVCGILIESRVDTAGRSLAVVGVGLNLDVDLSAPGLEAATSIAAEARRRVDALVAADAVVAAFNERLAAAERPAALLDAYRRRLATLGQRVEARSGDRGVAGAAEDVGEGGELLVRTDAGELIVLRDGEVTLAAPPSRSR